MSAETTQQERKSNRQNVLLKSSIDIGSYYFDAIAYDLSLYGAKIKLNLPLERGATFMIAIKGTSNIPSKVSWANNGFIGLEFDYPPDRVKTIFGTLGDRLT
ncbi:PilZ domain-containing protein [Emcibacteraceae bacterium Y4]|nr:PilZ domain-containing protein [Pseudemcibacter aquimaris]MCC3861377.1 PilZ domain-containing protein [Pseudemcibacter aquimaris]